MFRGATAVNLDSKGRVAIPTRYRSEILEESQGLMVCTVDLQQPCLVLYTLIEWENIEQKIKALPNLDPNTRALQRVVIGHATECELDRAGRILISPTLRQRVNLEKNLMLVGQLNKFEIWNESVWNRQIEADLALGVSEQFAQSNELKMLSL
ncbi:protein MraZ [Pasteurella multocida]|uniref:Transcriptional regulator MraZ n=1 Tax=Pasteurella dagmatis ATCC 43325 TaxID=667128 RepID=C9PMW6_9PAST|nr:division/cell wall cluster transcriptional repressor MraZ [Pasteurella dagmatis]EEX51150.1 protein MraZ [Pasteurella dagmatis ATCC 43325]SNV42671.1 protein MraZ [Pasteurella dagmatis]VEI57181.1 protein MraZ [Pasteurella multocida]